MSRLFTRAGWMGNRRWGDVQTVAGRWTLPVLATWCLATWCLTFAAAQGESVRLTGVPLVPPSATANRMTLSVDGGLVLGRDTDQADVTGNLDLDLVFDRESLQVTGLTVAAGTLAVSNTRLQLLGGLVRLNTSQVVGHPSTIVPPGLVSAGQFDAAQHQIVFDQGQLDFANTVYDLADEPIVALGKGTGQVQLTNLSGGPSGVSRYRLEVGVPVQLEELFDLVDNGQGPQIKLTVAGTLVGRTEFELPPVGLRCDVDLDRDVDSADLLKLISGWTGSLDVGQGTAVPSDGDCDLDGDVDSSDLAAMLSEWTGALAAIPRTGVSGSQAVGSSDLAAVPEPGTALTWTVTLATWAAVRRRATPRPA